MVEKRKNKTPILSVIIPVFNEVETIIAVLKAVRAVPGIPIEIVVVDDGSTDGTQYQLHRASRLLDQLILKEKNEGKGAAVTTGLGQARGEIVVIQDADMEYDPRDYPRLIQPILEGRADVVYGSRFVGSSPHRIVYFSHYLANVLLTFFSNLATNLNLTDMETGYKAFRRSLVDRLALEEKGFGIEPELTAKLAALGVRFYEIGISYYGRTYEEGKKIGFADFLRALWVIGKSALTLRIFPYLNRNFWL